MRASVAVSDDDDFDTAVERATERALAECPSPRSLLLLATHSYGRAAFERVARSLEPGALGIAQCAAGMVNGLAHGAQRYDAMFNKRAVAALAFGAGSAPAMVLGEDARSDPRAAGRSLPAAAREKLGSSPSCGLIFTPGLGVGAPLIDQAILDGIRDTAPDLRLAGTGLTTGMKVDGLAEPSLTYLDGRFVEHGVLLLAFGGGVHGKYACATGARSDTASFKVTESAGSLWKKVGARNAADVVLDVLSDGDPVKRNHFAANPAIAAAEHSVCLATRDEHGAFWCEPPIGFTPAGEVVAFYPVEPGTELWRVRLDSECALDAVRMAVEQLRAHSTERQAELVLSFSCTMRGFTLANRAPDETPTLLRALQPSAHLNVIANGEIGCGRDGRPRATLWAYSVCSLSDS